MLVRKVVPSLAVQTGVLQLFRGKAIEPLYAAKDSSALILVHCKVVKAIETEVGKFELTILTHKDKTSNIDCSKSLAARPTRCIMQCACIMLGANSLTRATSPECLPVIKAAPSVQMATHLFHENFD